MSILSFLLLARDLFPPGGKTARSWGNPDAEVQIPHVPRPGSGVCAALSPSSTAFEMRSEQSEVTASSEQCLTSQYRL